MIPLQSGVCHDKRHDTCATSIRSETPVGHGVAPNAHVLQRVARSRMILKLENVPVGHSLDHNTTCFLYFFLLFRPNFTV